MLPDPDDGVEELGVDDPLLPLPLDDPELLVLRREWRRRPCVLPLSRAEERDESPVVLGAPEAPIPLGAFTAVDPEPLLLAPVEDPDPDPDGGG